MAAQSLLLHLFTSSLCAPPSVKPAHSSHSPLLMSERAGPRAHPDVFPFRELRVSSWSTVTGACFATEKKTQERKKERKKKKKKSTEKKWECSADNTLPGSHFLSTPQLALGMGLHLPRVHFFTGGCGHPWAGQTA
ncbi:hypothetical protein PHYPO_G00185930 [Pangasianodon hypophthalmus]|uniref:Secreted protein n=1 Tax=Pangasianodon hypophthalmus TaxID=310915 RepID=A0A5N5JI85_PANHP|nr:hypothetical protein PHYPO_G00185930 [Pangasianodon hypophthalmus]